MAVEVTIHRATGVTNLTVDKHETGRAIFVSDGHLFVQDSHSNQVRDTVAAYAPGKWETVKVVEDNSAS